MPKKVISSVEVKVPNRSSFDKSFKNILTTKVGTLTPLVSKLLIPNSDFFMQLPISACLPPLASDTFMRCSLKVEAFAVPVRLLYGGFESWLTGSLLYKPDGSSTRAEMPYLVINSSAQAPYLGPGTLSDYLGVNIDIPAGQNQYKVNILKFLAYHRVYHDWYRNRKIQKPVFTNPVGAPVSPLSSPEQLSSLPFTAFDDAQYLNLNSSFFDGSHLGDLRQRNYGDDYFTVATTSPQSGSEQKVTIDSNSQFTISALRAANSLQHFAEKNNLTSPALQDYLMINYGAKLPSGIAQRSILLGSASYDVYSKGVNASNGVTATNNPFTSVGAQYGQAFASGSEFTISGHIDEPAYLMVIASLVPEANYNPRVTHDNLVFCGLKSWVDMPVSSLENVGNEPIYSSELSTSALDLSKIFGYVPRYTYHKSSVNEIHGLLRSGGSLDSFVAQRTFSGYPQITSNFLEIGTTDLDNVTAVDEDLSNYGCWIDCYVKLYVSEPLSESSLPSLQDPAYEHGHSVFIGRNGSTL